MSSKHAVAIITSIVIAVAIISLLVWYFIPPEFQFFIYWIVGITGAVLAVLAVLAAISGYSLKDIIYSDERRNPSKYPRLEIELHVGHYKDASTGQLIFELYATNLHNSLDVLNPEVTVFVGNPFKGTRHSNKDWILYTREKLPNLGPRERKEHLHLASNGSIESFLEQAFDRRLVERVPPNSVNSFVFRLVEDRSVPIRIEMSYESSEYGTKRARTSKEFSISPIDGAPEKWVTNWRIDPRDN